MDLHQETHMDSHEGLWVVSFKSNFQMLGAGVVVMINNQIFGGDSSYYFKGNLKKESKNATGIINVTRHNVHGISIFGNIGNFSLELTGQLNENNCFFNGFMVEQPSMKITIEGKKVSSL